jgi:tetratricopeptide (TPR) repeat protein
LDRWQRARAIEEGLAGEFPEAPEYVAALAEIEGKLGLALDRLGRTEEAGASLRRAVSLREALTDPFPEDSFAPLYLSVARDALGAFLLAHDRPAEARSCLDASAEGLRAASQSLPSGMHGGLARHFDDLAALYATLGDTGRAEAMTAEAQVLRESRPAGHRPGPPPRGHAPGPRGLDRPPPEAHWHEDPGSFPLHARRPRPQGSGPP